MSKSPNNDLGNAISSSSATMTMHDKATTAYTFLNINENRLSLKTKNGTTKDYSLQYKYSTFVSSYSAGIYVYLERYNRMCIVIVSGTANDNIPAWGYATLPEYAMIDTEQTYGALYYGSNSIFNIENGTNLARLKNSSVIAQGTSIHDVLIYLARE